MFWCGHARVTKRLVKNIFNDFVFAVVFFTGNENKIKVKDKSRNIRRFKGTQLV